MKIVTRTSSFEIPSYELEALDRFIKHIRILQRELHIQDFENWQQECKNENYLKFIFLIVMMIVYSIVFIAGLSVKV